MRIDCGNGLREGYERSPQVKSLKIDSTLIDFFNSRNSIYLQTSNVVLEVQHLRLIEEQSRHCEPG